MRAFHIEDKKRTTRAKRASIQTLYTRKEIISSLKSGSSPRVAFGRVGVDAYTRQILALTRRLCCRHCFSVPLHFSFPLSFHVTRSGLAEEGRVYESESNPRTAIAPLVLPWTHRLPSFCIFESFARTGLTVHVYVYTRTRE